MLNLGGENVTKMCSRPPQSLTVKMLVFSILSVQGSDSRRLRVKLFFKQNSIFTLLLDKLWKNRKKSIFSIFHLWVTQKCVDGIFYGTRNHDINFWGASKWSKLFQVTFVCDRSEKIGQKSYFCENWPYPLKSNTRHIFT